MITELNFTVQGSGAKTDIAYEIINTARTTIQTGITSIAEDGSVKIIVDSASSAINDWVRATVDDFNGINPEIASSATGWARLEELYRDFSITQDQSEDYNIQCVNQTGVMGTWDFGDGNATDNVNPVHTYTSNGTFLISNGGFSQEVTVTMVIKFSVSLTGNTVTCINQSGENGAWDFGDGSSTTEKNPSHLYLANGSYDVTLGPYVQSVVVDYYTAGMIASLNNNTANFIAPAGSSGEWDYGDGTTGTSLVHEFPHHGRFFASISGYNTLLNVLESTMPEVSFSYVRDSEDPSIVTFTADGAISYKWLIDGVVSTLNPYIHTFSSAGEYPIKVLGYNNIGNAGSRSDLVLVQLVNKPPVITEVTAIDNLLVVDFGIAATDDAGETLSYLWNFSDGQVSALQNPTITFQSDGTYTGTCTVTDDREFPLSAVGSVEVTVSAIPSLGPNLLVGTGLDEMTEDTNGLISTFYFSESFSGGEMMGTHTGITNTGRLGIFTDTLGIVAGSEYMFTFRIKSPTGNAEYRISSLDGFAVVGDTPDLIADDTYHTYSMQVRSRGSGGNLKIYSKDDVVWDTASIQLIGG